GWGMSSSSAALRGHDTHEPMKWMPKREAPSLMEGMSWRAWARSSTGDIGLLLSGVGDLDPPPDVFDEEFIVVDPPHRQIQVVDVVRDPGVQTGLDGSLGRDAGNMDADALSIGYVPLLVQRLA